MVKTTQSYSSAQDSNTALTSDGGVAIPLGEGQMLPRHVNDAIRALMADAAQDLRAGGRPATQSETFVVKRVEDNSAKGSMPAQSNAKLEIDGALNPHLLLTGTSSASVTYTFDTSDSSMTAALRFYADSSQTTEHTAGVTVSGTAGTAGSFTSIVVTEATPRILYYQLAGSAGLGGLAISAASSEALANVTGAVTQAQSASTAAFNSAFIAGATPTSNAEHFKNLAETAKADAETAKADAETAQANAGTAETNAVAAKNNAVTAQGASEAARDLTLGYRNDAQNAKTDAVAAKDLILAAVDDNLFLGGHAADPTTDNDGNALLIGAAYYNTTAGEVRFYSGSAWATSGGSSSLLSADANNDLALGTDSLAFFDLSANGDFTTVETAASSAQTTANNALPKAGGALTGAITGSGNINISGNIATTGDLSANNLQVTGTTTTISTTNLAVSDSLIELSSGLTGTPTGDAGLIIERGTAGDNAIFAWDESDDQFVLGTTTETGVSSGNLTIANANLALADLTLTGIAAGSTTTATGSAGWDVTAAQTAIITASGATTVTLSNAASLPVGAGLTLIVNDASGASLIIAGATSFKYPSATAPALSGTPGEVLVVSFIHTGSGNLIANSVIVS